MCVTSEQKRIDAYYSRSNSGQTTYSTRFYAWFWLKTFPSGIHSAFFHKIQEFSRHFPFSCSSRFSRTSATFDSVLLPLLLFSRKAADHCFLIQLTA